MKVMDLVTESLGAGKKIFWVIILSLFIGWAGLRLIKILKRLVSACNELLMLWNLISISSRAHGRKLQLHPYVCHVKDIDEVTMNELYTFIKTAFVSVATVKDFSVVINGYTHVLLCRSKVDGSLRGVGLYGLKHHSSYTTLKIGLFLFKNHYKGSGFLHIVMFLLLVKELLLHPLTPVYILAKSNSYKSYLMGMKFSSETYPRYDKETPPMIRKVMDEFAEAYLKIQPSAVYHPDKLVIESDYVHLAENITTLTEYDLQNPHIKYYVKINPGWEKGDCLMLAAQVTWGDILRLIFGAVKKTRRRMKNVSQNMSSYAGESERTSDGPRRRPNVQNAKPPVSKRRLLQRFTFQDLTANSYSTNYFEMDMGGYSMVATVPSPTKLTHGGKPVSDNPQSLTDYDVDLSRFKF